MCPQCGSVAKTDDRFCAGCGAALLAEGSSGSKDPLIGRTVGGSYVLQEIVGVGGMGRVYRAEQSTLGRTVAIKVIHPHLLGDDQTVARFYTEARASSRLNHPNSVSIIDFGRTDDGILYLAMEFLKGKDLAMVMHEEGPLPFSRTCDILVAVLNALEEAHANDIVHRDLKPENIILRRLASGGDLVKVVDFGLATIVGANSTSITRPGLVCGTPDYMAPEQGRGEQVDGRGDLYALGVVLFELLTDQLPFEAETPTKVVLRHINDPIPDPREVAPHRGIPDELAEVAIKALAKRREDRFQSARHMAEALKSGRASLANKASSIPCPACGTDNPVNMRFCGSCGNRLTGQFRAVTPSVSRRPPRTSFHPHVPSERPIVGRGAELIRIESISDKIGEGVTWVRIEGEPGVGKSRLLKEAGDRLAERGLLVVGSAPHPLGAPVPYIAIRQLVGRLLDVDEGEIARLSQDELVFSDPLVRAGLRELAQPQGLAGFAGQSRAAAVAQALSAVTDVALARNGAERAVLMVDDLGRCDGLSSQVLLALATTSRSPILLLTADGQRNPGSHADLTLELHGLSLEEAQRFLTGERDPSGPPPTRLPGRRLLPLYLEQIRALGAETATDESMPPRLADAVSLRFDRLNVQARRVLQTLAVFGGRAPVAELSQVVQRGDFEGAEELVNTGLVREFDGFYEIAHPFIAELVEAFIPAEARKELHRRVQAAITERGAPIEVRAEHAYRSGEPMRTLMTLERVGDDGLGRGDTRAGVLAYRRALELARREMLESGDTVMDTAILTFSRKLGSALARAGDLAGADGVVREVLDLTGPFSSARARMYVVLGQIAAMRNRHRDAMRSFGQALEIVAGEDDAVEHDVQMALGRARREDGDPAGAANAFRRAIELLDDKPRQNLVAAGATLELAEVLLAAGEPDRARAEAERVPILATDAPALVAHATALLARLAEIAGEPDEARRLYGLAMEMAANAGDARGVRTWADALALL